MNIKNLKCGECFYAVEKYASHVKKPKIIVFKVVKKNQIWNSEKEIIETEIIAMNGHAHYHKWYYDYVGQSEVKAKRVLEQKIKKHEKLKEKYELEKKHYEENLANIDVEKEKYLGKEVMIKFKSYPENKAKYVKAKITDVFPTYKQGVYSFVAKGFNSYLTSRENKNWYFWTREKELLEQRAKINEELKEIRKEK